MRKDLGLCLDEARNNKASLPVAALVDQFYAEIQAAGGSTLGHFIADPATAEDEVAAVEAGAPERSRELACGLTPHPACNRPHAAAQ